MLVTEDSYNATLEAIYWWNRTESYYHSCFLKMSELEVDSDKFRFFVSKVFHIFLTEYSVRRNIASGEAAVYRFVEKLCDSEYYDQVASGNTGVIDRFSNKLSCEDKLTNGRQTHSLLSKVAFLINPTDFSLIDSYAKKSLWHLVKESKRFKRAELNLYSGFTSCIDDYICRNPDLFANADELLKCFPETDAANFFSSNEMAFHRRIFDKILWVNIARSKGRVVNNCGYREFLNHIQ